MSLSKISHLPENIKVLRKMFSTIDPYARCIERIRATIKQADLEVDLYDDEQAKEIYNLSCSSGGKNLPEENRIPGEYPVMGSNGQVGIHNSYLVEGPSVIVGRKGSAGQIVWEEKNCNPIDTTFYVNLLDDTYNIKFVYVQ